MDTNNKNTNKEYFINKFQKSLSFTEQAICWEHISIQELKFEDWQELTDQEKLSLPIHYNLYNKMKKKAVSLLHGKELYITIIRLTSINDFEYYPAEDNIAPYYEEILNYQLTDKELINVFLSLINSFNLFNKTEEGEEDYESIEYRISVLITKRDLTFEDLAELNYLGIFHLFQDTEKRLRFHNIDLKKAVEYSRMGMIEKMDINHEDNLIENVALCSSEPTFEIYLKFKELAEDEDIMDNLLYDARSIVKKKIRRKKK